MKSLRLIAVISVFLLAGVVLAQQQKEQEGKKAAPPKPKKEKVERLKPRLVTAATRTPLPLEDIPASAAVVDKERAEVLGFSTVDDWLRFVPGLYRRRTKGFMDSLAGVQLRGFKGRERTLCLFDDIPIHTGYTGVPYLDMLIPYEIKRIEVVKGPFSALYGGHAMGGVVKVVPEQIPPKPAVRAVLTCGNLGTTLLYGGYSFWAVKRRLAFRLGYKTKSTDGYESEYAVKSAKDGSSGTPVTGWIRTTDRTGKKTYYILGHRGGRNTWFDQAFSLRAVWMPTEKTRLALQTVRSEYRYDYTNDRASILRDASGNIVYSGDPSQGYKVTFNDGGTDKEITLHEGDFLKGPGGQTLWLHLLSFKTFFSDEANLKAWVGVVDVLRDYWFSPSSSKSKLDGTGEGDFNLTPSFGLETGVQFMRRFGKGARHRFICGATYDRNRARSTTYTLINWLYSSSKSGVLRRMSGKAALYGLYTQFEIALSEKWVVVPALRYDWWRTYDGETYDQTAGFTKQPARTSDAVSPKFSFLFKPTTGLRFYGSYGGAFRAPSVYELYRTWSSSWGTIYEGNPDLKPEKVLGIELGFRLTTLKLLPFGATHFAGAYFNMNIEDLIYYETVAPKHNRRTNAGKARNEGYEFEIAQDFGKTFKIWFNFTDVYARITDNPAKPETEGKRVTYVPRYTYNFGFEVRWRKITAALTGRFYGKIYLRDDNSDTAQGVPQTFEPFFNLDFRFGYKCGSNIWLYLTIENLLNDRFIEYSRTPPRTVLVQMSIRL